MRLAFVGLEEGTDSATTASLEDISLSCAVISALESHGMLKASGWHRGFSLFGDSLSQFLKFLHDLIELVINPVHGNASQENKRVTFGIRS